MSACAPAAGLAADVEGLVEAFRTTNLLEVARDAENNGVCDCCWSLLGRVQVENDAAAEDGARIAGG